MKDYELHDSGERQQFDSGAVRDSATGKGRFDLISPIGLRRLAATYEKGCIKYSPRNWEKGMPISRFLDSAARHINNYLEGEASEDHLAQAAWNLFAAMHFEELRPDLQDIPTRPYESSEEAWAAASEIDDRVSEPEQLQFDFENKPEPIPSEKPHTNLLQEISQFVSSKLPK